LSIYDLLLILLVFATATIVVIVAVALFRRRWAAVGRLVACTAVTWVLYLGVGTAVALSTPQHIVAIGEDRCFDEMCFAVMGYNRTPSRLAGRSLYSVHVRITNRSRGRTQRERGRIGVLIDRSGRTYEVSREGTDALLAAGTPRLPGLDAEVGPGQSVETTLVFDLPTAVGYPGFALESNLAIYPARIAIGDEEHFLHWPTVVPLD
jgi:hypothetical protein